LAERVDIGGFTARFARELLGGELGHQRRLAARGRALGVRIEQCEVHQQRPARVADQACFRPQQTRGAERCDGTPHVRGSACQLVNDAQDGADGQRRHIPGGFVQQRRQEDSLHMLADFQELIVRSDDIEHLDH
jgi:hypothetical protein